MDTRVYARTSWPWAGAAVLLFWQTWFLCHVYATERSAVRWTCDSDGCGTDDLAGGALLFAALSAVGAVLRAAPFLGAAGAAGLAVLLAGLGLLVGREDDHAVVVAHGLVVLGALLLLAGTTRALRPTNPDRYRELYPELEPDTDGAADTGRDPARELDKDPAMAATTGATARAATGPVAEPGASRLPLRALLRLAVAPGTLGAAVLGAAAVAALVYGAFEGPRWLMMLGLNATLTLLVMLARLRLRHRPGVARGPVDPGRAAHAPAWLHSVRARGATFVFDLTVLPDAGPPYRIEVEHPLDLQDARTPRAAVVRHEPRRPWRVELPLRPPADTLARARAAARDAGGAPPAPRLRVPAPGTPAVLVAALLAAALLTVLAVT
ncbi:hypothetical protein [Streptomyces sp. NPDC059247]|uniref:hypothetical protein n=1 Tax=Streptomyces sp. NPDC059247 TaxID=3346790 RepID=UPI0036837112